MGNKLERLERAGTQLEQWNSIVNSMEQLTTTVEALFAQAAPETDFWKAMRHVGDVLVDAYSCANNQLVQSQTIARRIAQADGIPELPRHYSESVRELVRLDIA